MTFIVFGDTVKLVINQIEAVLPVPVVAAIPNPRPDEFVLVRLLGGTQRNVVTDQPTMTVEAFSATKPGAAALLQKARAVITQMPHDRSIDPPVYLVQEFAGPADLPDPESTQERHTYTVSVAVRGATGVTL